MITTLIKVAVVLFALWLFYNGIMGAKFRSALHGSKLKGGRIPTWLGELGFFAAGLFVLYFVFRKL
jgi:hypothetical protein